MGCFPYECVKCGGGYKRCGNQKEHAKINYDEKAIYWCDGGQFCWENSLIIQIEGTDGKTYYISGIYSGYGYAEFYPNDINLKKAQAILSRVHIHSQEFQEYFDDWGNVDLVAKSFICQSCFERHQDEGDNKELLIKFEEIKNLIPTYKKPKPKKIIIKRTF